MNHPPAISVKPNPVKEGESVTVTGDPGKTVLVGYKGTTKVVTLDREGKAKIKAPGEGGESFTVSDGKFPNPSEVEVKIISNLK